MASRHGGDEVDEAIRSPSERPSIRSVDRQAVDENQTQIRVLGWSPARNVGRPARRQILPQYHIRNVQIQLEPSLDAAFDNRLAMRVLDTSQQTPHDRQYPTGAAKNVS